MIKTSLFLRLIQWVPEYFTLYCYFQAVLLQDRRDRSCATVEPKRPRYTSDEQIAQRKERVVEAHPIYIEIEIACQGDFSTLAKLSSASTNLQTKLVIQKIEFV